MQKTVEWITGNDFRRMIVGSYQTFMREHEFINSLNVFPVPDGDTGTNMLLTLNAVAQAVSSAPDSGIGALSKRAADSAIMGARGNSGVILSQIFRGIARGLAGKEQATSQEVGKAFQYGVLYAYRAVSKPVEGTILTVAKGIAKGAHRAVREGSTFVDILNQAIEAGKTELARTPELLPVLKAAGVVDAGGQGLIVFLRGCLEGLGGEYSEGEAESYFDRDLKPVFGNDVDIKLAHPYCTEFLVRRCQTSAAEIRRLLIDRGDSLVVAEGSECTKIHIHTAHPGQILELATAWGTLHDIKIDNMADQHKHRHVEAEEETSYSGVEIISVAAGDGIADIMRQMGAHRLIMGGQTMNPPVEDFIKVIHSSRAEKIIILPNNKNIILAAEQVKKLLGDRVEIVPTVNIPYGLAALMAFDAQDTWEENVRRMRKSFAGVKAAAITVAVRDSMVDEHLVAAGRYIGVMDCRVMADAETLGEALVATAEAVIEPQHEVVSLYYGAGLTAAEAEPLAAALGEHFPAAEVQLYYGGQPHYQFIISME